jgi:hypothetical protein
MKSEAGGGEEMNYGGMRASSRLAIESHILIAKFSICNRKSHFHCHEEACQIVEFTILAQAEQKKEESDRLKIVSLEHSVLPV